MVVTGAVGRHRDVWWQAVAAQQRGGGDGWASAVTQQEDEGNKGGGGRGEGGGRGVKETGSATPTAVATRRWMPVKHRGGGGGDRGVSSKGAARPAGHVTPRVHACRRRVRTVHQRAAHRPAGEKRGVRGESGGGRPSSGGRKRPGLAVGMGSHTPMPGGTAARLRSRGGGDARSRSRIMRAEPRAGGQEAVNG